MINYSIIIPHKNIPDLLQRCLDSIPRRKDVQIIVVDDNSDTDKVDFANFPGLKDPFVEVIFGKNENGRKGAGYARNLGLERAKGKWLLFADADDFFTDNAFDSIFSEIASPHEVIYFKAIRLYSDTCEPTGQLLYTNQEVDNYINKKKSYMRIRYHSNPPWGKMISQKLVARENIRFDEISSGNDLIFSVLVGHFAKSINAVDKTIYCYTISKGSITYTQSLENLTARYLAVLRKNKFLRKVGKNQYQSPIMFLLTNSMAYGTSTFLNFVYLCVKYKNNPIIGATHWISKYFILRKNKIKNEKYFIK